MGNPLDGEVARDGVGIALAGRHARDDKGGRGVIGGVKEVRRQEVADEVGVFLGIVEVIVHDAGHIQGDATPGEFAVLGEKGPFGDRECPNVVIGDLGPAPVHLAGLGVYGQTGSACGSSYRGPRLGDVGGRRFARPHGGVVRSRLSRRGLFGGGLGIGSALGAGATGPEEERRQNEQ